MKPARKLELALVRKPTWQESHGPASHADHRPEDFAYQREMNRRDGSTFEPSSAPFKRNLTNLYRDARMVAWILIEAIRN